MFLSNMDIARAATPLPIAEIAARLDIPVDGIEPYRRLKAKVPHGGVAVADLPTTDVEAVRRGLVNLERHVTTLRGLFGQRCVVAINRRAEDDPAEVDAILAAASALGVPAVEARHFAEGGVGARDLALAVMEAAGDGTEEPRFAYERDAGLWEKMRAIATRVYGAADITADSSVHRRIRQLEAEGNGHLPVCVAKTQYSFATDKALRGAPSGHVVDVREVRLSAGAGFVVMICGSITTMPGLPAVPAASTIDVTDEGQIVGLF